MIKILNVSSFYSGLYQAVEFCKNNLNEKIEIIVPDKLSLFMEKFLFEQMNISASFKIKVSTLNRFAKKGCIVPREQQISKVGSIILIHKILNENIDKLEVLKSKAFSFSYAEDIFRTIGQFKSSKINCEEMKHFTSTDVQLNSKIKDLALVYSEYESQKAGLLDASDLFLMSVFSVAEGRQNSKLLFVGFDDFTAIEYAIIERLALVAEVNVLNYRSNGGNKFIFNTEVISQLKNIAYLNELPFELADCKETTSGLKTFLEQNLFAINKNQFELNKELVKVFAGNNINEEIEFVARDIRTKILSGQKYKDFGVAIFGFETCENKIKEIFNKYDINYYLDGEVPLIKSGLYKFYINVLKYNLDGHSLSNLIDLINSPFFVLDKEDKRTIIDALMRVKFKGRIGERFDVELDEDIKTELLKFINKVEFNKDEEICDIINKLKNIEIDFDLILDEIAKKDIDSQILLRKSKDVLFNLFDDIMQFNCFVSIEQFYDILKHSATIVKINNLPLKIDSVKVVDANNSMEIFDELYVVGANQGSAPNLKFDCGIILDGEIEKLNFANKLSPTISHINKLARLRLFNLFTMFEKELVVTYANNCADVVTELLEKLQIETEKGIINIVPISLFGYEKYLALSKWDYIEYICKNKKLNENTEKNIKNNEKIIKNKDFSNISRNNLSIYSDFNFVSATTLENYFKCPFMAFLTNIMKIKPKLENEILALDIGNVLHEIMFKYYKLKKEVDDIYEFCKTEVFRCVGKEQRLKLNADSPILTNLIDEAIRVVNALNYIDENSLFEPRFFEYDFKGDKALHLKNISIIGKVDRVDVFNDMFRVVDYKSGKADASLKELYYGNKLQLFLYSCAMENVLNKKSVGSFYLPLHNAYTKELGNTYSLKGFYLAEDFVVKAFDKRLTAGMKSDIVNVTLTKNESVRKSIGYKELESGELLSLKNYSKLVSENAVDEIRAGFIKPTPSEVSKPCEYCPYVHVCMKSSNNIEYRKANKVDLNSFREVHDERV